MAIASMTNNVIRAKLSTHSLVVAAIFFAIVVKHFMDDPNAVRWLDAHWFWKDLIEGIQFALPAVAAYLNPTKPSA